MQTDPRISLCMIVRDAEHDLAACLRSVGNAVDEIVIVDTGSRDRTQEVARAFGARLLESPWQDDFAAARNVGLEAATGDWILFLDADERLVATAPEGLRNLARSPDHVGYYFQVRSPLGNGDSMDVAILRMFRASHRVRFRYPIHEQVLEDLIAWAREDGLRFSFVEDVHILHDGYRAEVMAARGKAERNRRLFLKAVEQYPDNAYLWYKWADALRSEPDRASESLHAARRAVDLLDAMNASARRTVPYVPECLAVAAAAELEHGNEERAAQLVRRYPPSDWPSSNYYYVAAHVCEVRGEIDTALEWALACQEPGASVLIVDRPGVRGPLSATLRARLQLRRGCWREAEREARRALALDPAQEPAYRALADALVALGDVSGALMALRTGLEHATNKGGLCLQTALLLLQLGQREKSRAFLRTAADSDSVARVALAVGFAERPVPLDAAEAEEVRVLCEHRLGTEIPDAQERPIRRLLAPLLPRLLPATAEDTMRKDPPPPVSPDAAGVHG